MLVRLVLLLIHILGNIAITGLGLLILWQLFLLIAFARTPVGAVLAFLLASLVGPVCVVAVHELGHVYIGYLAGIRFRRITLPFVRIEWSPVGWEARWHPRLFSMMGLVNTFDGPEVGWRHSVMVAGGPAANLLLAISLFVIAAVMPPRTEVTRVIPVVLPGGLVAAGLNVVGLISLAIAAATLLPGTALGVRTDGGQLWDALVGRRTGG